MPLAMNESQVIHALLTPVRRFPTKAVARATENRELGVAAARHVLRAMLDEVEAGAQPRLVEGTLYFDPAISFGAIHGCWLLAYHGAREALVEFERVVHLSGPQLDALLGDVSHETLPAALDGVADDETLLRWAGEPLAPEAEAAVHDALVRRLARGELERPLLLDVFSRALERWRADAGPDAAEGLALAALAYLGVCLAGEAQPLRALLDVDGVGANGALTAADLARLPRDEAELGGRLAAVETSRRDPRSVEAMQVYGWVESPGPTHKKMKSKKSKKSKRKKRR